MSTNADCTRTIIDPAPTPGCDYSCHITAKGNVHNGLPQNCNWCRPFTRAVIDHHIKAAATEWEKDQALARCGESGGIRPSVSERVAEIEAAQDHPAIIATYATMWTVIGINAVFAVVVIVAQICIWIHR